MTVAIDQISDKAARMMLRAAAEIAARGVEPVWLTDRGQLVAVITSHVPLGLRQPYDPGGHEVVEMGWEHECG